ncbi:winged helix-turn-helix domain-containing protein [Streptomyces sp. RFCAC02]|uniref:ArsR/SmtB family transcription factor n=1 Tax=Streptomyces sp. RFCAC02 TaxID=2499143 RepID=UPI00101F7DC3|nr:winged helix-turn-helix domain-containing protein [Streptomyces sp. RFCAC02]
MQTGPDRAAAGSAGGTAPDDDTPPTGDRLLAVLAALSNPHRMRIIAALAAERTYVSRLARVVGLSRPLTHMHLRRLEEAGLITGSLELSDEGRAMKFFEVTPFVYELSPRTVADAAGSLSPESPASPVRGEEEAQ